MAPGWKEILGYLLKLLNDLVGAFKKTPAEKEENNKVRIREEFDQLRKTGRPKS
jgi:hypothetical protein